jgi:hypothetical protein
MWWLHAFPIRRSSVTRRTVRPAPDSGSPDSARTPSRARSTSTTWSITRTSCANMGSVRGLANGDQSSRRSRAARGRHLVGCRRTRSGSLRCRAVPGSAGRRLRITGDPPRCQNPAEFSGTMTCSSPRRLQQLAVEEVNGSIVQRKRRRSRNPRTACQSECQSNTASLGELAHEW